MPFIKLNDKNPCCSVIADISWDDALYHSDFVLNLPPTIRWVLRNYIFTM